MTFPVFLAVVGGAAWTVAFVRTWFISNQRVSRWAYFTGMPIDDVRGARAHADLARTYRWRRAGGFVGMIAGVALATSQKDSPMAAFSGATLAFVGFLVGAAIAEVTRRPTVATRRVAAVEARDPGAEVGGPAFRRFALWLALVAAVALLVEIAVVRTASWWTPVVPLVGIGIAVGAFLWCESLPRWGSDPVEVDVLAASRVAGVRLMWSITAGLSAIAVATVVAGWVGATVGWSGLPLSLVQVYAMQLVAYGAAGQSLPREFRLYRERRAAARSARAAAASR